MIKRLMLAFYDWKVEKKIQQLKKDCEWVEKYLASSRLPRANRRRLIKSFGTLALRIAIHQNQKGSKTK